MIKIQLIFISQLFLYLTHIISHNKQENMTQFRLSQQFLKNDIQRIDNANYFMKDFQCAQLIKFFSNVVTMNDVLVNREIINLFYDHYVATQYKNRSLYTQIKWIAVVHQVVQVFKENSPLYAFTLKALQTSLQNLLNFQKSQGPYEKYLMINLVKPYIQFLCKLCLLSMPQQTTKYDKKAAQDLQNKAEQQKQQKHQVQTQPQQIHLQLQKQVIQQPVQTSQTANIQKQSIQQQNLNMKLMNWYRKYNFVSATIETLQLILLDTNRFFSISFPYLNNIGRYISQDLNDIIFKLKYMFRSLKKSNVTVIELDQLQNKLKLFISHCSPSKFDDPVFQLFSKIQDFEKKDLQQFLSSPLRPNQLRLYSKKSVGTPIKTFINS